MFTKTKIIKGKYLDSVKLMLLSKQVQELEGVQDAVVILASPENRQILAATDMLDEGIAEATENDIVIVVKAMDIQIANSAIALSESLLDAPNQNQKKGSSHSYSIASASDSLGKSDLCLISVAGKYAAKEAEKALDAGLHVLLFSDNVSLKDEIYLKQKAVAKSLLMMGPDCGTAIINGIPLAFANKVPAGGIGIVAASGTGLQEITAGIANRGCGISQAFGTGGRDGKKEVGGLMLLSGLEYLMNDPATKVIVILAKTPDVEVRDKIWAKLAQSHKPTIVNFLRDIQLPSLPNVQYITSLDGSALAACNELMRIEGKAIKDDVTDTTKPNTSIGAPRQHIRGLYSGGTLCYEAQQLYWQFFGKHALSNVPLDHEFLIQDVWKLSGDCLLDMGSDEFTVGRPHPMIDFSLRLKMLQMVADDPQTAIILIDVVLGYGANPDPASELVPILKTLPMDICIICNVLGTDLDPQDKDMQIAALKAAGAIVFTSHHLAASTAMEILREHRSRA